MPEEESIALSEDEIAESESVNISTGKICMYDDHKVLLGGGGGR